MASTEEDFPRGGKAKQTTESKAEPVRRHTEVDNLFETHEPEESKKRKGQKEDALKKAKRQKTSKEEALKLNTTTSVDILQLKSLKVGTLLLGCVKEVADFEVTINLPSGLLGYLNISNISDSYTKILSDHLDSASSEEIFSLTSLFSPGMLVRCVVARLDTAKGGSVSIQLSINPKAVNKGLSTGSLKAGLVLSGCVESIEDHGYLVDLGIKGTKAFLPKQAAKDKTNSPKELKVGQYVTSLLEEVKNDGRVVRLSISPTAVAQAVADTEHGWTLTNLLPGLVVKAQIKKVTLHGLILDFLSSFTGLVDFMHLEPEQASTFNEGDNVKACVLYVEPSTRLVGLSLRSYLLQPGGDVDLVATERIGEVAHGCKMTALHHLSGAMLKLPDQTVVFVHRNHMKEPREAFNLNRVMAKPEHTCRIMDFSPMEQVHLVSLRQSIINAPFFRRYHDIQPGQIVQGTVTSLQSHGMMVKVTDYIRGLVPRTHLSDIILKNPEKKYAVGMTIKCRVLSVDPQEKKLTLTRKRALVDSSLPLFLTYKDARRGRVSHGFIVCVKDFGCIVCFYGEVKGLVPPNELSTEPVIVPENMFYVGQVVKAKVLNCDVEKEKLLLSFKAVAGGDTEASPKPTFDFEVGKKVEVKVVSKVLTGLEVSILPEETIAFLPMMHLSDHVSNCQLLWEGLQEGDIISNVVCLSKKKPNITLTKKPTVKSFLEEGGVVAKEFSDITVGVQLIGWVKNIMPYGVFVEFPYGLVGLAPKAAMSEKFVSDTAAHFQLGHTVVAKVTNLDEEKHRFLVSLKVSEVISPKRDGQARLIRGLQERKAVMEMMASRGDSDLLTQLSAVTIGQKMKMSVDEVREDGSVTFKSDELSAATVLATKDNAPGKLATGQKCMPVILHVDLVTSQVYVSLLTKLTGKRQAVLAGSTHTATVHHADRDFAVISLGDTAQLTVIQTTNHLNETFRFDSEKLTVGKTLTITVTKSSCEELEGLPLVSWELAPPERKRFISASKGSKGTYRYGDVVKGKVKKVKPTCVLVTLEDGSTGCVHVSEIQEVVCVGTFPTSLLKIGSEVTARVIGGREGNSHRFLPISHPNFTYSMPELTLLPSKLKEDADIKPVKTKEKLKRYQVGDDVICFVSKYFPKRKCLEVTTGPSVTGTVEQLAMTSDPKHAKHPEKLFKLGQAVSAKVVTVSSSKPSRLSLSLNGVHKLEKGHVIMGLVQKLDPNLGLLVKLPFSAMGTVALEDLADKYKPKPLERYSKDQLVRCCIVGEAKSKWQLSLRPSRTNPGKASVVKDPEIVSLEDLSEGQIVRGYVRTVNAQGVFVSLSRSINGRAQFQKATKYFVASHQDYAKKVPQSTLLTTKILSIDKEKGLVDLSLLQEDTGKPDVLPESLGLHLRLTGDAKEKRDTTKKRKRTESESKQETAEKVSKKKKGKGEDSDSGVEVYFREEEVEEEKKLEPAEVEKPVPVQPARLQVTGGFSWDAALSALKPASAALGGEDSSDGEDDEVNTKPQKKSRHKQEVEKREAEKALTKLETELMDPGLRPQTAASFERLLLSSPDSSLLWLQFMAFHLQATQIEQARAVAERALKTISFREEQEKLNVWVALLNLENLYGTEESLQKVFERAVQYCEPMPVYQQLADIYAKCQKTKEAEGLYKTMVKRFRQEKAVWLSYGTFLLQQGQSDAASALLQRAIKSLPNKDNVDLIAKFAQLEFRYGDVERGKTMLDKILTSYPKRTDLWSVFIDLMVKHGSQKEVRAVFDRVIHLSVAVKRIKFFFKRYLEYEKKNGTPESIQAVKEKALEYVESKGTEAAR
ncbi:protein RRP5 homolog [Salmo salar]|uniref:Protein RRP5 homolog n=1 Tax=Salmo salar TaxID=8030 RepID=A0ABM3CKP4_SALSA|nr:protein RRP5 homolog [Salmo salar]XP_045547124.1 protein RRP5 homolog [Salmo salar]